MKKVFCIGLPKTGTTSIGKAFELLGYKHNAKTDCIIGCNSIIQGNYSYIIQEIKENDFFEDTPYHLIYEWLDTTCEAKFILTTRLSPETYLESLKNEPDRKKTSILHQYKKLLLFGVHKVDGHEQLIMDTYEKHNSRVRDYFRDRDNFLELCFEKGDGWPEICGFFNLPVPHTEFPHVNRSFLDNR